MKRFLGLLGLLSLVALFLGTLGNGPAQAAGGAGANVSLSASQSSFAAQDAVMIHVTITNPNSTPLQMLSWHTPVNGVQGPLFEVLRDGQPVPYLGMLVKRSAPTAQNYITLAAGEQLDFDVNLADYYSFAASGTYTVKYDTSAPDIYITQALAKVAGNLASNQLSLQVDGRADPALKSITPNVVVPAPISPNSNVTGATNYANCNATQQTQSLTARNNASDYAATALGYFTSGFFGSRYVYWFGVYDATRWNTVKTHYTNIQNAINTQTVTFDCSCTDAGTFAYVYPSAPYSIYLCGAFWGTTDTGTDSRAGTLIHEMSHFTVLAGTSDYVYGQSGAHSLAGSNPANAIMNADSHEYFAEDNPHTADSAPASFTKSAPANASSASTSPTLSWNASSGLSGYYQYCLDASTSGTCQGGWTTVPGGASATSVDLTGLTDATQYQWQVRAVNADGNVEATGGMWNFTANTGTPADTTKPTVSLTSNPSAYTKETSATFEFTGADNVTTPANLTFTCAYDAVDWASCTSPLTLNSLTEGAHTVWIYATDEANNSSDQAIYTWNVDTTAPTETTLAQKPDQYTKSTSATFAFNTSDNVTAAQDMVYTCALDTGSWQACSNPVTFSNLGAGSHTLWFYATDQAGNDNSTIISQVYDWIVDTTAPNTTLGVPKPTNPTLLKTASFSFSGTDGDSGIASYQCKLDAGTYAACASPKAYSALALGTHTFYVRAIDTAGNVDASPATYTWLVWGERAKNGGFNTYTTNPKVPTDWTSYNFSTTTDGKDTLNKYEGAAAVKIAGVAGKAKELYQTIFMSGKQGDKLSLSFWNKGTSSSGGECSVYVDFYYGTTYKTSVKRACSLGTFGWTKMSLAFNAPVAFTKVVVDIYSARSSGAVWFDLVSLLK